jgi:ABC-2 type transport system ATP-binding protein
MMIETRDLWKVYGRTDGLKGLSLSVPEGAACALIGANGAGKTTTIKVLMNILAATSGSATVLGVDSGRISPKELRQIGYVSESQRMPGRLTVAQYLGHLRPFYPTWDLGLERSILDQLQLPLERKIRDLSHGMRMKMSLACALPFRPRLLVLDEPFSGLDPLVRDEFMERLLEQAGDMTVLISTHDLSDIENVATHVAFLEGGKLLFHEPMTDLLGRLRSVRIVLTDEARELASPPSSWRDLRAEGNVLRFVETQFSEDALNARIAQALPNVRIVECKPMSLRSIFTVLARDAQRKGH